MAPDCQSFLDMLLLEIGDIDRRIAAGESLARDRFDSDCVLGTQFESSQPHHALSFQLRFPGSRRLGPNWRGYLARRCLCHGVPEPFEAVLTSLSPPPKIPFPGNRDCGSKRLGSKVMVLGRVIE